MLILLLNGFLTGVYQSSAAYLENTPGSIVVARRDGNNFRVPGLPLPPGTADAVRTTAGVAKVIPLLSRSVYFELNGQKQFVSLIGYDSGSGGGPWSLVSGHEPHADNEVVLDRVLAQQRNIVRGSRLTLLNRTFTVVGLSAGTSTWMMSYAFLRKTAAESLLLAPGATNYLLVTPTKATEIETIRHHLQTLPETTALLKSNLIANDVTLLTRVYRVPMQLMVMIAFLVGVLIVGLIIYTGTVERQREYGVLKAIGARNRLLSRVVTTQAGLVAMVGALAGIG
jgi:putative ABC transport system permease protein